MDKQTQSASTLGYKGNVKVTIKKKGKVVKVINGHNNGTYSLFYAMASSIIGQDASAQMPKFLEAYQGTQPLRARSKLEGHIEAGSESKATVCAVFVANIPYSSLTLLNNTPISKLELYNQFTGGKKLAEIDLGTGIILESTTSAMVEWKIEIRNDPIQEKQAESEEVDPEV